MDSQGALMVGSLGNWLNIPPILTIPLSETKGKRSNLHINVFLIEHKKDFTQQNLITICFFLLLSNYTITISLIVNII
jgi:hypothetical protein